jgi:anti-anti-sigma regulatory factor
MSFSISEAYATSGQIVLSVTGVVDASEGGELYRRIHEALEDHDDVALDLRRCVFIDPSHLTSVLRLRRSGAVNGSQLSLVGGDRDIGAGA